MSDLWKIIKITQEIDFFDVFRILCTPLLNGCDFLGLELSILDIFEYETAFLAEIFLVMAKGEERE